MKLLDVSAIPSFALAYVSQVSGEAAMKLFEDRGLTAILNDDLIGECTTSCSMGVICNSNCKMVHVHCDSFLPLVRVPH